MNHSKRVLSFLMFSAVFIAGCRIDGLVTDACSGQPIVGATVTIQGAGTTRSTITDGSGAYAFEEVENGQYNVTVASEGLQFYSSSKTVTVSGEAGATANFVGLSTDQAWKNSTNGLTYIHLSGNPTMIGCQHGTMLKDEILAFREDALDYLASQYGTPRELLEAMIPSIVEPWYDFFTADALEEMQAIANATGVALDELVLLNIEVDLSVWRGLETGQSQSSGGYLADSATPNLEHCSGFAARGNATSHGKLIHGYNMDINEDAAEVWTSHSVLAFYHPYQKNSFVAPTMVGSAGVFTGMNSQMIAIDNGNGGYFNDSNYSEPAFRPLTSIIREALENASNISEAVSIMSGASSYRPVPSISLISSGTENDAVTLEMFAGDHFPRTLTSDVTWHANQFQAAGYWPSSYVPNPNNRSLKYEELLYNPGTLQGSIDITTAIDDVLSVYPICQGVRNELSILYLPQDMTLYVSTLTHPACGGTYLGFNLTDETPL